MRDVSNMEDIIDSRDVIKRLEELEEEITEKGEDPDYVFVEDDSDEANELRALRSLADQASGASGWHRGETLIRNSYFQDYARQLTEDIGAIDRYAQWPLNHIDWEGAAGELQHDYMEVDFDGISYWIRA